jgi:hypothetical protein
MHLATALHLSKPTMQQKMTSQMTTLLRPLPLLSTPTWLTFWRKRRHPSKPMQPKSIQPSSSLPLTMHSSINNSKHRWNKWQCSQQLPPGHATMRMCPHWPKSMPCPPSMVSGSNPTILLKVVDEAVDIVMWDALIANAET